MYKHCLHVIIEEGCGSFWAWLILSHAFLYLGAFPKAKNGCLSKNNFEAEKDSQAKEY